MGNISQSSKRRALKGFEAYWNHEQKQNKMNIVTVEETSIKAFNSSVNFYLSKGYELYGEPIINKVAQSEQYQQYWNSDKYSTKHWTESYYSQCLINKQ